MKPISLSTADAELLARHFHLLADPLRLRILHALEDGPLCVGELSQTLATPQPSISKQLKILQEGGLLERRRAGTTVYYTVAEASVFQLCSLVCQTVSSHLQEEAERSLHLLERLPPRLSFPAP